jgi:hypothetical protein
MKIYKRAYGLPPKNYCIRDQLQVFIAGSHLGHRRAILHIFRTMSEPYY